MVGRPTSLSRTALLLGGAGLLAARAAPALAGPAPDADLAELRLLVGVELLAIDFHTRALATGLLGEPRRALTMQLLADERAHYRGLVDLLGRNGQVAATADDIDFSYPPGTFAAEAAIARRALAVEELAAGAYVGAAAVLQAPELRLPVTQIAANEAQHAGALAALAGKPPVGRAFAAALPIAQVSDALDGYES